MSYKLNEQVNINEKDLPFHILCSVISFCFWLQVFWILNFAKFRTHNCFKVYSGFTYVTYLNETTFNSEYFCIVLQSHNITHALGSIPECYFLPNCVHTNYLCTHFYLHTCIIIIIAILLLAIKLNSIFASHWSIIHFFRKYEFALNDEMGYTWDWPTKTGEACIF